PPGIDGRFRPGGSRSSTPLVAAVGRLVPVKQLTRLVKAAAALRATHPCFEVVIAGEGYERAALESAILANGMGGIVRLAGHIDDGALVDLYRSAWVVVSASAREGWGMTITEAAACATPSIASRIAGHVDAVEDGRSGLLFGTDDELVSALGAVLSDEVLRRRLGRRALERSRAFSWEAAAAGALDVVAAEVCRHRRSR
ncbi:MAG: glycosyltransferase, partial [Acidimicrobiales bacterium]